MDSFANFTKVTVSTGYDASATTVVLSSGEGARWSQTLPYNAVWWNSTDYPDPNDDPNREIVRVTAISTDTLTVTRAQESTSATTKNTASKTYKMHCGATATTFNTRTGTGAVVLQSSPSLTTPTIGDFTNATHTHANAAGGGQLSLTTAVSGTLPIANGGTAATTAAGALDSLIAAEVDVASATTTDLGAAASQNIRITGTTTITGFGTVAAGVVRRVRFSGALTLTHNATSLILPGAANITTVAGDSFMATSLGSGNWKVYGYWRTTVTGTGSEVLATSPALTTPTIADLTNATHTHQNAAGGGTLTLASAAFPNQGTTTQVLHGNASGNPSWSAVSLTADVSGTLPVANGGTGLTTLAATADALSIAEADVASATTTDLGAATTTNVRITGTTTITSFGSTAAAGVKRFVRFSGALTLTYNATSLILPTGATITTAAGDSLIAESLGSGNWFVYAYIPASGYLMPSTSQGTPSIRAVTSSLIGMGYASAQGSLHFSVGVGLSMLITSGGVVNPRGALALGNGDDFYIARISSGISRVTSDNSSTVGAFEMAERIVAKTSNYTVLASDSNTHFTNTGASAEVDFTLPTPVAGYIYKFSAPVAQIIKVIAPASTTIEVNGTVSASAGNVASASAAAGVSMTVSCISTSKYFITASIGTLTVT